MAILNNDKQVARDGRKKTLKDEDGVVASLRDQIPRKLLKKVRGMKLGVKVSKLWSAENVHRAEYMERQEELLEDYDEFVEPTDSGPFQGSSTLHLPTPLIVAKALHARYLQALRATDPGPKARTAASVERQSTVADVMRYAVDDWGNQYTGFGDPLDTWVWNWTTRGEAYLKLRWEVRFTKFMDVVRRVIPGAPRTQIDEDGNERLEPVLRLVEQEEEIVKKVFEGPWLDEVPAEDVVVIGGKGIPQLSEATIHRDFLPASTLWTLVDRQIFDNKAVKKVIMSGPDSPTTGQGGNIKQRQAIKAGEAGIDKESDSDKYEILEAYLQVDIDDSGINSDVVLWVHNKTGEILSANYLHRMHKSGEIPIYRGVFHKRQNSDRPVGIIEIMHPLTTELDAMHNMNVDNGLISNMPWGFYRPTSSIQPETLSLSPGTLIPVDNPQADVFFPNLGNRTTFGFQEQAAIQQMIDRLTGISDLNLGVLSGQQGATRTATGTRAILGESNSNLNIHLRRLLTPYRSMLNGLLHMLQQRIPPGLSFRLTDSQGSDYWPYIRDAADIAGDFDFDIDFDSASSNPQIQAESSRLIYEVTSNPLDYQLGVISPQGRYEAIKNYLQKAVGVKTTSKYIQSPNIPRIFTPEEEAGRILRGIPTPVTPEGDHDGFSAYVEQLFNTPEMMEQFAPEDVQELELQRQRHQQMAAALEEQRARVRELSQQRQAAQTAANQAPTANVGAPGGEVAGQQ